MKLVSPTTGAVLRPDGPHTLVAAGERWPVLDGIAYLRTGRETLIAAVLQRIDAGRITDALILLLADQDDWWRGPPAEPAALQELVARHDTLSLRAAMALLGLGPVADYFAHRWSDPTYLAGLALIEAHWNAPDTAFELACGIGHYLRDLSALDVDCTGADVVFAKCWLARHFVAPQAHYLVFDAASPWPIADARFGLVLCHDAFYFLPDQDAVAQCLRAVTAAGGRLSIGHLHNAEYARGALGPAREAIGWQALFPRATVYDERELRRALLDGDTPVSSRWAVDPAVEAWSLVEGADVRDPRAITGGIAMPPPGARLRPNPLLGDDGQVRWPSARYAQEYGPESTWADDAVTVGGGDDAVRRRRLVALPERW